MVYLDEYKSNTNLPTSPASIGSRTNVFGDKKKKGSNVKATLPTLPTLPTKPSKRSVMQQNNEIQQGNNDDTLQSHHHKSVVSSTSVFSNDDGNEQQHGVNKQVSINSVANSSFMSIPNPQNIGDIDIPQPMEAIIDVTPAMSTTLQNSAQSMKYEVSFVGNDTPTVDNLQFPERVPIDEVNLGTADEQLSGLDDDESLMDEIPTINQRRMQSVNIDEPSNDILQNNRFGSNDSDDDSIKSDSDYGDDDTSGSDSDSDSTSSSDDDGYGTFGLPQEEEKNICTRIAKVLYENSWTGEMISNSTEFSKREYNALLDVGNIPIDSYISNLVWKIIFYSQKKTEDDLINEDKPHIKWYWWDSNDIDSDWKWRKYNVIICQWITETYQLFLDKHYEKKSEPLQVDFRECQKKLEKEHEKTKKKTKNKRGDNDRDDDDGKDDEKESIDGNNNKNGKKKKITIDAYFDKNKDYEHVLQIGVDDENNKDIIIWHKIKRTTDNVEYCREIRVEHKLFSIKQDMRVDIYQQNPSPFAIPPQLAAIDA